MDWGQLTLTFRRRINVDHAFCKTDAAVTYYWLDNSRMVPMSLWNTQKPNVPVLNGKINEQ